MKASTSRCKLLPAWLIFVLLASSCAAPPAAPGPQATPSVSTRALLTPTVSPASTALAGSIRPAAFAGTAYPGDPEKLRAAVDGYLQAVEPVDGEPMGLIVPHAGYDFSGPVAAYGFKQMEGVDYDVAVIISNAQDKPISTAISVGAEGGFQTPLGVVPVDQKLAKALIAADAHITFDPADQEGQHTLELELPFLQRVCPSCSIVPILMGNEDEATVQELASALLSVLPGRRAVVIASSDLSHYPSYQDAMTVDQATLAAIETGDPNQVRATTARLMAGGYSHLLTCACAEGPIRVMMRVARALGADTVTLLHYANSGDVPGGDKNQVVGYGAVMFWRYQPPDLTDARRTTLLTAARSAIAEYVKTGHNPEAETADPELNRRSGAFVTITENGVLRGCIGRMEAVSPLYRNVQDMAVAAATSDPRFPPLDATELDKISLEISILSPLHLITDTNQIRIGTDGLLIVQWGQEGVFLPQVPVEQGWDTDAYLSNLCLKAGLPEACWHNMNPTLYSFTATVFGEKK
jgi:AmmeMemoRadiSam system protein B/AmmeMemoRadiSam system protein A